MPNIYLINRPFHYFQVHHKWYSSVRYQI